MDIYITYFENNIVLVLLSSFLNCKYCSIVSKLHFDLLQKDVYEISFIGISLLLSYVLRDSEILFSAIQAHYIIDKCIK